MKIFILFILLIFISSCSNTKKTYWCGDHPCINKAEKESYFKENMIIEVRNIDKKNKKELSNYEKLMKQAKIKQKNEVLNKKEISKENKKSKKVKKQAKIKKKKLKIKKKKELKKDTKKLKNKKVNKQLVRIEEPDLSKTQFDQLLSDIREKNALKPYPDINNTPY